MAKQSKKKKNNKKLSFVDHFKSKKLGGAVAILAVVGAVAFVTFPASQASGLSSTPSANCSVHFSKKHTANTQYAAYITVKNTSVATINTTITGVTSVYYADGMLQNSVPFSYPVTLTRGQRLNVNLPQYTYPGVKLTTNITVTNASPAFTCTKTVKSTLH